jgi:hypothetical protein
MLCADRILELQNLDIEDLALIYAARSNDDKALLEAIHGYFDGIARPVAIEEVKSWDEG